MMGAFPEEVSDMANPEVERNLEAYRRVKGDLDSLYPKGEFVVFAGGGAHDTHTAFRGH